MTDAKERELPTTPGTLEGICPIHLQRYEFAAMIAQLFQAYGAMYDVACGCGYGSRFFDSPYVGIDLDATAVAYATEHYAKSDFHFEVADAEALAPVYAGWSPGAAVSFETLEHLHAPEKFLKWCGTHCELFICSTPIAGDCLASPFHVREYSVPEFRELLTPYWARVKLFVQREGGIQYPCPDDAMGVVLAVCY